MIVNAAGRGSKAADSLKELKKTLTINDRMGSGFMVSPKNKMI